MSRIKWKAAALARKSWDRVVHGIAEVGHRVLPPTWPGRYGVRVQHDLVYGDRAIADHRLDVYRPEPAHPEGLLPALVYVHGGGFTILSRRTHRLFALQLARLGFVVFNVDYRLAPAHRYPIPLEDAARALCFVHREAARFGADPERLVLAGESAGANLVTALAYASTHPRPEPFARALYESAPPIRAVLAYYGIHEVHDVERLWRRRAGGMPFYVRQELKFVSGAYLGPGRPEAPLASPLRLLEQERPPEEGHEGERGQASRPLPPFFLTAGTADPLLDDSRRLAAALRRRGAEAELFVYPGEVHGFNAMLWRRAARDSWAQSANFLRRYVP